MILLYSSVCMEKLWNKKHSKHFSLHLEICITLGNAECLKSCQTRESYQTMKCDTTGH